VYTGEVKPADRTQVEDDFQKGDIDIIVGTLDALKEGITLTASAMMYMMTRFFVPDYNEQFEARCDRLGQQEQVLIYIPQAEESVATSKVEPINRVKERIVRAVVPKDEIQEVHS
jgi:SNF2 family DNA or RNA helicase